MPDLAHPRDLRVIRRIGSGFIQEIDRLPAQLHEVALESKVTQSRDILVPARPIVRQKQGQGLGAVEERSLDWYLLDVRRLGDFEGLGRTGGGGGGEIEVGCVEEYLYGPRCGRRG